MGYAPDRCKWMHGISHLEERSGNVVARCQMTQCSNSEARDLLAQTDFPRGLPTILTK